MRPVLHIVVALVIALLVAFALGLIADALNAPSWVPTVIWVVAVVLWALWSVGARLGRPLR